MHDLLLVGGRVLTAEGMADVDVAVAGGRVIALGRELGPAREVLDCAGAWVGPGFVDVHTHAREPGGEWKEDLATVTAAAVAGGYTAILTMPNTDPPVDGAPTARYVLERGRAIGRCTVGVAGTVTLGRRGEALSHIDDLWDEGVRVFTDDGDVVADAEMLRRALAYIGDRGGVVAQHAVDATLARGAMHEGWVSARLGMRGIPAVAETTIVARDLLLVADTPCRYHVQHVAAAGCIELIARAKDRGLPVTAEVTPHHLTFDHTEVLAGTDPVFKMMPPLRTADDVTAVREALRSGIIDLVATDHAPHADHEKDVPFEEAPNGVIGLEWAAAAVNSAVGLDPERFFDRMSIAPARLAGFDEHGHRIAPGRPANLVVFDPTAEWVPSGTMSRSRNSPYLGRRLVGRVRWTIVDGTIRHEGAASRA